MQNQTSHETASASQNRAIAKDAALIGLPTLRPEDMPTKAQRRKWADDYRKAQDGALKLVGAVNSLTASAQPENVRETDKFRLYIKRGHAYLSSKVNGKPLTVNVRRKGGDFNYLRGLSDSEFNASACLEFGCGLYQS